MFAKFDQGTRSHCDSAPAILFTQPVPRYLQITQQRPYNALHTKYFKTEAFFISSSARVLVMVTDFVRLTSTRLKFSMSELKNDTS